MQDLLKKHETKLRFGIIGGINTALDFGLLFVFSSLFGIPRGFANMLSTSISFIFSFFANKRYTFKSSSKENVVREMVLFTVVTLFGLWIILGMAVAFFALALIDFGRQ